MASTTTNQHKKKYPEQQIDHNQSTLKQTTRKEHLGVFHKERNQKDFLTRIKAITTTDIWNQPIGKEEYEQNEEESQINTEQPTTPQRHNQHGKAE